MNIFLLSVHFHLLEENIWKIKSEDFHCCKMLIYLGMPLKTYLLNINISFLLYGCYELISFILIFHMITKVVMVMIVW